MTTTDKTPGTPALNKALAAVQASLPKISKDQEGKVSGEKNGRSYSYTYKYADLSDLSEIILPLLGKNGLAFTAMPGLNDGKFGLTYALLHESGEEKGGFYPITHGTPQQNGSAITYARRYCLGAVTGVAPAEDDDGAAGNDVHPSSSYSAGDAWEKASPAPSKATDDKWVNEATAKAPNLTTRDAASQLYELTVGKAVAGEITEQDKVKICSLILGRVEELKAAQQPPDDPWLTEMASMSTREDAGPLLHKLEQARGVTVNEKRYTALKAAINIKADSLPSAPGEAA